MFATYSADCALGWKPTYLSLLPLGDKMTQRSNEHIDFWKFEPEMFEKSLPNVDALIGDNYKVNRKRNNKMEITLFCCASHLFQLAVKEKFCGRWRCCVTSTPTHDKVTHVPFVLVKLRRLTSLRLKVRNETRWTSMVKILLCHKQLREHVVKLNIGHIDSSLLNTAVDWRVDNVPKQLGFLDDVIETL